MPMRYYIVECTVKLSGSVRRSPRKNLLVLTSVLSENPTTEFTIMNNMYLLLNLVIPADIHYRQG